MKIIYSRDDGGVNIISPAEGARLATQLQLKDGTILSSNMPQAVDQFLGRLPVVGSTVTWAETPTTFAERIAFKDVPSGKPYKIVDVADIPSDRTFRNAWCVEGNGIGHNYQKCCDITKERLRAERAPLLAASDVAYMRAQEAGASTTAIVAEKQRLRDVTKLVTADLSLDALKMLKAA